MSKCRKIFKLINRFKTPVNCHNLRRLEPISRVFGFDRGTPIDRVYIEHFLSSNKQYIQGVVCEIAEDTYSKKYGSNVKAYEIFHYIHDTNDNPRATIVGDLTDINSLPQNKINCFILTQTLNFIYDFKSAIKDVFLPYNIRIRK